MGPRIRAPEWAYTGGNLKVDPPPLTADRPPVLRGGGGLGPLDQSPRVGVHGGNLKMDPPPLDGRPAISAERRRRLGAPGLEPHGGRTQA